MNLLKTHIKPTVSLRKIRLGFDNYLQVSRLVTRILVLPRKNPGRCREEKSFESASDFLLIAAPAHKNQGLSNNRISSLSSKRGKVKVGTNTGVEVRYHERHEWNKLSEEEKNEVR